MTNTLRIDKWLWAARFYKKRSLATAAVIGGKVHCNGQAVKPSALVRVEDTLVLQLGQTQKIIIIKSLSDKRGPASFAQTLYEETVESLKQREEQREMRKLMQEPARAQKGNLNKKDKRAIAKLRKLV